MMIEYAAFVALAINPFGGLLFAIPYAKAMLGMSPFVAALIGVPLSYVQVLAVDWLWQWLSRIDWWRRFIERRRTPRLERMTSSPYMFWLVLVFAPFFGPWLVMAVMRYANVPHKRVALPMALGLAWNAMGIALVTLYAPRLLPR